jgi:hypothetical protein
MKIIGGEIYVTLEQVCDACGLSYSALRVMLTRGSVHWQTAKDPEDLRRTLILYKVMLPKYRKLISNFYCQGLEPAEWLCHFERSREAETGIVDTIKTAYHNHASYLRYYASAQGADERKTQKTRKYLARAASCMAAIHIYYNQNNLSLSDRKPIKEVSEYLTEEKDILFPKGYSYMKCSVRHIHEALKQLAAGTPIDEVITQPRIGNENRLGEDHAYIKGAVARMLTSGKNPTVADIVRKVQFLAAREEKRKPSVSTIYNYVAEMRNITTLQRYGSDTKAAAALRFSIPTAKAMYSGDCWEMDGTRVQLQPFTVETHNNASVSKIQYLYIVAVRDVYSGAFLGWSFGLSESFSMYSDALKMATTLAGYLPHELRHDRFPGHNSDQCERLFEALRDKGCKLTKTSVASGKVHLERAFGTLQGVFESDRHTWVGQGIKSSRNYARPTADYLARVHKSLKSDGFGWEDAWRQENEVVMTYNYTPLSIYSKRYRSITQSPIELHDNDTERPNVIPVESWDISELFWATRKVSIRNYAVSVEVNRKQYTYMLTDEKYYNIIREHSAVLVRFDTSDMSEVMLFDSLYGTFLNTVQVFEAPQLYGANPEYGKLAAEKAKQKALKQRLNAELAEVTAACDDDILGISISHMIPKQNAELAETSAMAAYWRNTVPVSVETLNEKTQKQKTPKSQYSNLNPQDSIQDILNQL